MTKSKNNSVLDAMISPDTKRLMEIRQLANKVRREHQLDRIRNREENIRREQRIREIYRIVSNNHKNVTDIYERIYEKTRNAPGI